MTNTNNVPTVTFAADATLADVIALYVATATGRVRSYKVQSLDDDDTARVDMMFVDNAAARRFVRSLYAQDAWSFCGDVHVSKICDYKVVVILDVY